MSMVQADIVNIKSLTDSILQLFLRPKIFINYEAGQYLKIDLAGEHIPYSIANAPENSQKYELHIRHYHENLTTLNLLEEIQTKNFLNLSLPFGSCHISRLSSTKPILFIAIGTGFAPIKAMIEQLLINKDKRMFKLFWGVRRENDLYMEDLVAVWKKDLAARFEYFPIVAKSVEVALLSLIRQQPMALKNYQIVIAGPFDSAIKIKSAMLSWGVEENYFFSDAFE